MDSIAPFAAVICDFQKCPLVRTHSAMNGTPRQRAFFPSSCAACLAYIQPIVCKVFAPKAESLTAQKFFQNKNFLKSWLKTGLQDLVSHSIAQQNEAYMMYKNRCFFLCQNIKRTKKSTQRKRVVALLLFYFLKNEKKKIL